MFNCLNFHVQIFNVLVQRFLKNLWTSAVSLWNRLSKLTPSLWRTYTVAPLRTCSRFTLRASEAGAER